MAIYGRPRDTDDGEDLRQAADNDVQITPQMGSRRQLGLGAVLGHVGVISDRPDPLLLRRLYHGGGIGVVRLEHIRPLPIDVIAASRSRPGSNQEKAPSYFWAWIWVACTALIGVAAASLLVDKKQKEAAAAPAAA